MLYISFGLRKSGSTLAFELTRGLLQRLGHSQRKVRAFIPARHSINFLNLNGRDRDRALERLAGQVPRDRIVAVKTHSAPTALVHDLVRDGHLQCQAIYRDPRDNVLSLVDAGLRAQADGGAFRRMVDIDHAVVSCARGFQAYDEWCEVPGILTASYDEVAFRSEDFLLRVMTQLGVQQDAVDRSALCSEIKRRRFTQFNKGVARRHRRDLSVSGWLGLTARFADLIERHMVQELDELDRALLPLARTLPVPDSFAGLYRSAQMQGRVPDERVF